MRAFRIWMTLSATAALMAFAAPADVSAGHKLNLNCTDRDPTAPHVVYAHGISCRKARQWAARVKRNGRRPEGWSCRTHDRRNSGTCRDRDDDERYFGWYPFD